MKKTSKIIFLIFSLAFIVSGCSIFSSIGDGIATGYQSFTGYFNTYYNATTAFSLGEESVYKLYNTSKTNYPTLDKLRLVSYFEVPPDAKTNFDKVVEKCSKIFNYNSKSTLVDDALLLIGKAYFYNLEYTRAERKFLELISQYPESNLIPEAKLWCAKTFLKNRKEADAQILLKDVTEYAQKEEENELILTSNLIMADYDLFRTDTNSAVKYYNEALKFSEDKETSAQIYFRLGEINEKHDSLVAASDYYFKAARLSSANPIKYWGMNKYGTIQIKFGKYDFAAKIFQDLEKNPQLKEFLPYTMYEIGDIKVKRDEIEDAINIFNKLDTLHARTEPAAKGYYQMGLIHEKKFFEYQKAKEYYQKSKEQMSGISISQATDDKVRRMESYLGAEKQTYIADSLFILANVPDTAIVFNFDVHVTSKTKDSSSMFSKMKSDTMMALYVIPDSANRLKRDTILQNLAKSDSSLIKDTILTLKHNHIDTIKSTEGPNLKIQNYTNKYSNPLNKVDTIIVSELDRILSIDSARLSKATKDLGRKKYDFANAWLTQIERQDTAISIFEELLYKFPKDDNYYPEMIYYLSSAYHKDSVKIPIADSLLRVFIDKYPSDPHVFEAKMLLGISIVPKIDTAKIMYDIADSLYVVNKVDESLKAHEEIVKKFPTSSWASKSLYAIGWIHENGKKDYKEAIKKYRKLLEDYPSSIYAGLIKTKIDTVEKYFPTKPKLDPKKDSTSKSADSLKIKTKLPTASTPSLEEGKQAPADSQKTNILKEMDKDLIKKPKADSVPVRRRREFE